MNKKLILGLLLCNMLGISFNILGIQIRISFYQYQCNEKKELKCMCLNNDSWQESTHKKNDIGKDFPNPIDCQLDLNIQRNDNKMILKTGQDSFKIDATSLRQEIATLLKTNPTKEEPLFIEIIRHEQKDNNTISVATDHYRVTEILKPQPVHVKYYHYHKESNSMKVLNGTEWQTSERQRDKTPRFCALEFSENYTHLSSIQPVSLKTNQPEGGKVYIETQGRKIYIETPSLSTQILINDACQSNQGSFLLIEIGNELYWVINIETPRPRKQHITDPSPSDSDEMKTIKSQFATRQITHQSIFYKKDVSVPGYTKTQIMAYTAAAAGIIIIAILLQYRHSHPYTIPDLISLLPRFIPGMK